VVQVLSVYFTPVPVVSRHSCIVIAEALGTANATMLSALGQSAVRIDFLRVIVVLLDCGST